MNESSEQTVPKDRRREQIDPVVAAALAEHGHWLRKVLAARGVDRTAVEDALQTVCVAAMRNASQLKDRSRVGAWLYRIAVVEALQYRRRAGRRRRLIDRYATEGGAPEEAVEHDPLAWLLTEETQQLVRRAIAKLPPQDVEILLLKYTEDWSYREIAARTGISVSAIEARLHRARGRLRAALAKLAPEAVAYRS